MHGRRYKEREKKGERESGDREWLSLPTPSPFQVCACNLVSNSPAPIYCVVQFFRILYFSWRITFFLIMNYLFNFNLYEGKKLVAFNWELVTLSGCKRLLGRFPVLSSLNIVQWHTWRSSEFGRNQKCLPHARKKPPVPRVITGFKWKTTPTQPQTQPIFFCLRKWWEGQQ